MLIVRAQRLVRRGAADESALCYHGLLRVSTGLSLLEGMIELQKRAEEINTRKSYTSYNRLTLSH